ncbi:FixH family protein [Actinopolymorpha sp. B17G11]|uniref:copper resistance CopC/CopD family protein n=1 Tax=Actinopolymorpha sp. B17G11 TaxID=3160861 RepID=UPI0032E4E926
MTLVQSRGRRASAQGTRTPSLVGRAIAVSLLVLGCWAALLVVASPSTGDAVLRSTSPGNGETARPERLLLTFDRPVPAGFVTVRMTDPYRREVVLDRPSRVDGRADTISVPMPRTRFAGTYAVAWSLPSSQLEPVGGTFTFDFVSRSREHPAPRIETEPSTVIVVVCTLARFAAFAAMAVLVGAVFFVAVIWPAGARRVRRLITYAWLGLVAATLAVLVSYGPYAAWAPLTDALDPALLVATFQSEQGAALLARLLVLVLAGFAVAELVAARPPETRGELWLRSGGVLGCTAALAATWALPGHTTSALGPLEVAVDIVHLTAFGVLVGGLVLSCAAPLRNREVTDAREAGARFFRVALVCLGVLVLTGGYQSWRQLGGLDAVTATPSGWLLLARTALVVALAAVCVAGRWWLRRRDDWPRHGPGKRRQPVAPTKGFRRLMAVEAGVAGTFLAVTALLVAVQPGLLPATGAQRPVTQGSATQGSATQGSAIQGSAHTLPAPARLAFDTGGPGGKGWLDLVVVPATVGENTLHFSVLDRKGAPKDGSAVKAVLQRTGGTGRSVRVTSQEVAPGHLVSTATIPARGEWELALTIQSVGGHRQTLTGVVDVG